MKTHHLLCVALVLVTSRSLFGADNSTPQDKQTVQQKSDKPNTDDQKSDSIIPPTIKSAYVPVYPIELFKDKIEGKVLVDLNLDKHGIIKDVSVINSTDERFNESALVAARKFELTAAEKNGKAVAAHARVNVVFSIKNAVIDAKYATTQPVMTKEPTINNRRNNIHFHDGEKLIIDFDYVIGKNGRLIFINIEKSSNVEVTRYFIERIQKSEYIPATYDGEPVSVIYYERGLRKSGHVEWIPGN